MGVRYAYGCGHTAGVSLVELEEQFAVVDSPGARVRAHEVALNLGGGVMY